MGRKLIKKVRSNNTWTQNFKILKLIPHNTPTRNLLLMYTSSNMI